ncbi:GTPase, partial [Campylobacter lari]
VKANSLKAAKNSDIIFYMVDGKFLPDDEDKAFFYEMKKLNKPIALVINKIDNKKDEERSWEFSNFGVKEVFNISVTHNIGIDELCMWAGKFLNESFLDVDDEEDFESYLENFDENSGDFKLKTINENHIKVGIIGRVNVGKSSLLNALVKEERSVVSDIAGTTIDPVNESIMHKDKIIEFVDTAGIRKRGKIQGLERYALNRT